MKKKIFGLISVSVIVLGAYFIFFGGDKISNENITDNNDTGSALTEDNGGIQTNNIKDISIPNLDKKIVFSPNVPSEAVKILTDRIEESKNFLKKDSALLNEWLNLGINLKVAGDYEFAKEVWEYANILNPENSVSFLNLGDLYGYYLKDLVKAERNYRKAVDNDLMHSAPYMKFADFYIEVMNDKNKALLIIKEGLGAMPNDLDLQAKLSQLEGIRNMEKGDPKPM